jgi:hypothetical protein
LGWSCGVYGGILAHAVLGGIITSAS